MDIMDAGKPALYRKLYIKDFDMLYLCLKSRSVKLPSSSRRIKTARLSCRSLYET